MATYIRWDVLWYVHVALNIIFHVHQLLSHSKNSFDWDIKKKIPIVKLNWHGNIFSQKKTSTYNLSVVDSKNVQSLNKLTQKSEHWLGKKKICTICIYIEIIKMYKDYLSYWPVITPLFC